MNLVIFSCVPWASDGVFTSMDTGCGFISVAKRTGGDEETGERKKGGKSCKFDGKFVSLQR